MSESIINYAAIEEKRRRRAQSIAAMGLVEKTGANRFKISTPSLRGRQTNYFVTDGKCSCLEFEEYSLSDPNFKCEHILAAELTRAKI